MMLEPLGGLRVVDLYAGSGALGIEALSRGAIHVDFVESARQALAALAGNLEALGLGASATVWPLVLPAGVAPHAAGDRLPPTWCWRTRRTAAKRRARCSRRSARPGCWQWRRGWWWSITRRMSCRSGRACSVASASGATVRPR